MATTQQLAADVAVLQTEWSEFQRKFNDDRQAFTDMVSKAVATNTAELGAVVNDARAEFANLRAELMKIVEGVTNKFSEMEAKINQSERQSRWPWVRARLLAV